ncbi:MAG: autotransporter outer membrane beta-barrel domain-containing protein [Verrucomicrobiales bacterium]|nr:autotransporter outer membrane beta-barrel domain-containing protein [Verrucomicrobiales bacterium]
MKTRKLTLILTLLCALSVSALNVLAQNLYVNGTNYGAEADQTYVMPNSWTAGLFVANANAIYSGTNINVSGTLTGNNGVFQVSYNGATAALTSSTITLSGSGEGSYANQTAIYLYSSATLSLQDVAVNVVNLTTSDNPRAILVGNGSQLTADNLRADVKTAHSGVALYMDNGTGNVAHLTNSTLVSNQDHIVTMYHSALFTGSNVTIHSTGGTMDAIQIMSSATLTLTDSSVTADGNGQAVISAITAAESDPSQPVHIEFTDSNLTSQTGALIISGTHVVLQASQKELIITGGTVSVGAELVNIHGNANLAVTINDATVTNGADLLTVSDSAALTVTINRTEVSGDITQNDDAAVTVILDNHSTGTGGYNGGSLITGGDSTWTFNKNSHGNYGENNGVWNIGDYEVIFDNLTHTGTVNLNVNSDTGAGGSITVTGTADGEGTVHLDTTGNGKLNPNDVLPGVVSGDGTENWQWDPIDWGIDTIIKDGDHFVKSGVSPAGAVLNSSVAIQQAMWFAQQNSLLKRMGELRFNYSNTISGKDDKEVATVSDTLISNIWLRSYGQQLNVGGKVAGRAYEQLIYGVDLGTDHKFTISADSDLYLGVFTGYGRSDLDYRTPGTDGEINSYYGGLYATWLHSSGFYIDATVKAASVNNDLKAPYGNTQLKANYSDVNLGGNLELGKKFTFSDAWFIEPQFQVNYLHILAENYTAGPMTISAQDLDALQLRLGSVFGRTINLTNSGALQPYVKISGVETISSGGTIRNGYQSTRANTDGARAELGAGLIWQLDADNQLHLDYEASFGDKYDKPWGLTAGYRHQF